MNNIIIEGYNKKINNRTIYAREYYLKNKYKKMTYYKQYYVDNKNHILVERHNRRAKLPDSYVRIRSKVVLSWD